MKYILIILLLISCKSKQILINKAHIDSTNVKKELNISKNVDSSKKEIKGISNTKTFTKEINNSIIKLSLLDDSCKNDKPIIITESNGVTSIDLGGRKLKDLTKKDKNSKVESKKQSIDTTKTLSDFKDSSNLNAKSDSTSLIKDEKNISKKKINIPIIQIIIFILLILLIYYLYRRYKANTSI